MVRVEARLVEKRLLVPGREAVAASLRGGRGVVHLEDAACGLLLEPLARVALVRARGGGELAGGQRAPLGERAVEAEAIAQIDAEDIPRPERRLEEPLHERVPARRRFRGQVRSPCAQLDLLSSRSLVDCLIKAGRGGRRARPPERPRSPQDHLVIRSSPP